MVTGYLVLMIQLRPAAAQELKRLLRKQSDPNGPIHLYLQSGGCAEWTYCLSITPPSQTASTTFTCGDLQILVPNAQLPQVQDLTIDYAEDLMGGGFRFINPQARQTCGCGNSFSLSLDHPLNDCS
jgi:iron-sulfur cluster assembly protein